MSQAATARYVDAQGRGYQEKPEHMTHLHGNLLVPKSHDRIVFRGKLDSLAAKVVEAQVTALDDGRRAVAADLQEIMTLISGIMMGEATGMPLREGVVLGLREDELRAVSHHPKKHLGVDHMIPHCDMGKTFAAVNVLRTQSREAELAAVKALTNDGGAVEREDILRALNRLSSAFYIIMCRLLAGRYDKPAR